MEFATFLGVVLIVAGMFWFAGQIMHINAHLKLLERKIRYNYDVSKEIKELIDRATNYKKGKN